MCRRLDRRCNETISQCFGVPAIEAIRAGHDYLVILYFTVCTNVCLIKVTSTLCCKSFHQCGKAFQIHIRMEFPQLMTDNAQTMWNNIMIALYSLRHNVIMKAHRDKITHNRWLSG